jgi:hypothetical protein
MTNQGRVLSEQELQDTIIAYLTPEVTGVGVNIAWDLIATLRYREKIADQHISFLNLQNKLAQKTIAEKDAEIKRLRSALQEIRSYFVDYDEANWHDGYAFWMWEIADKALEGGDAESYGC